MAKKILLMKGISGSGKSTYAKGLTLDEQYFRVNRDELRPLIAATKWSGQKEKMVVALERAMATEILERGKSVVVDDTNLSETTQNMWKQLAEHNKVGFEIKEIKTPIAECIVRDSQRTGNAKIGRAVIERQALKSGMYNLSNEDNSLVICDIDGTILDGTHREHYLKDKQDKNRWVKYYGAAHEDVPFEDRIEWLRALKEDGKTIVLLTGRAPEMALDATLHSIEKYNIPCDRLWMRHPKDSREDTIIKQELLNDYLKHHNKKSILFCIEDRPRIIRMWKQNGLAVLDVGFGIEF